MNIKNEIGNSTQSGMMINCCFSLLIQFLITNVNQYSFREVDLKEERTKSEIVEIFTIGCHGKKY